MKTLFFSKNCRTIFMFPSTVIRVLKYLSKISYHFPGNVCSAVRLARYFYDLEIFTSSDTLVQRLLFGEVTITQEVTR